MVVPIKVVPLIINSNRNNMKAQDIKIGDFVHGQYKYGNACGLVLEVFKTRVVIQKYHAWYEKFTPTNEKMNLTISRIYQIKPAN